MKRGTVEGLMIHEDDIISEDFAPPTSDSFGQLLRSDILHFANSSSCFKVDHITLVTQPTFEKVKHLLLDTAITGGYWQRYGDAKRSTIRTWDLPP